MPLPLIPIALAGAGALLGGIAGAQGNKEITNQRSDSGIALDPNTAAGNYADEDILKQLQGLQGMVNAGPGQQDVTNSLQSQQGLAAMLQQYSQNGGQPNQGDITNAGNYANSIFASQQTSLNQGFDDQQVQMNRIAGQMGRGANDPIFRNKLMQEQTRQQQSLDSQKTGFSAQYAQNMPMQRLGFASQLADVQGSLASQAMSNRQALLGLGQSVQQNERNFRLQTGRKWSTGSGESTSGGGIGGAISGALSGAGTGLGIAGMFSGGGGLKNGGGTGGGLHAFGNTSVLNSIGQNFGGQAAAPMNYLSNMPSSAPLGRASLGGANMGGLLNNFSSGLNMRMGGN